jgi:plastocyanin
MVKPARLGLSLLLWGGLASAAAASPPPPWLGDELPLPLSVKSAQDLAFKNEAERQYLIFNLMAAGKLALDGQDYGLAVRKWEALLKVPGLPEEIERAVRPLLAEAQRAAGGRKVPGSVELPFLPGRVDPGDVHLGPEAAPVRHAAPRNHVTVSGTVTGGGAVGPGGAVLWLRRLDGPTPAPTPVRRSRTVNQKDKTFVPRVLAVPVGSRVQFRNDDPYYHNVFSLGPAQKFDTGLYAAGLSYSQAFTKPGLVELFCNIHASMRGYIYVVDSPYYAQPRPNGTFVIADVPPGRYELSAWHESSATVIKHAVQVGGAGVAGISLTIPADRPPSLVVPDKYGKPRQPQLGY